MIGKKKLALDQNNTKPRRWLKWLLIGFSVVVVLLVGAFGLGYKWYQDNLKPVNEQAEEAKEFAVMKGDNASKIAKKLVDNGLIRNHRAFELYNRLNKTGGSLQEGTYYLKPSMSVAEIVAALTSGKLKQQMSVTFFPGATLNFRFYDDDPTPTHREALQKVGFSDEQIDVAFAKTQRDHPLFELLPEVTNLEGLIYPETLHFDVNASIEDVLKYYFDHYHRFITDNKLVEKYQEQGLTLYQGIIMASMIERELAVKSDRAQAAQIFLKRARAGDKFGSDVTYQYASRLAGTKNNLYIDSPYNTRRYAGWPPTPIASPSTSSLLAVANPAEGDYNFFLTGDDGKNHFSHTYTEHESKIKQYCKVKCSVQ
ncbi:MAG: endolytic transglycosylase MltG [Candidatus Nanosyncoccaceae bacterium]|jgi:UPF0755 protein